MPIQIKESESYFNTDKSIEFLYDVAEITLFEGRNKIKVSMVNKEAFDKLVFRINRVRRLIAMDSDFQRKLFKITYDVKNCFYFRNDNFGTLEFLMSCQVISEQTYQSALKHLGNVLLFPINTNKLNEKLVSIREDNEMEDSQASYVEEKDSGTLNLQASIKSLKRNSSFNFFSTSESGKDTSMQTDETTKSLPNIGLHINSGQ